MQLASKISILFLLLFLFGCNKVRLSGEVSFNGKIIDAYNSTPIEGIIVYMAENPKISSNSNSLYENLSNKDTSNSLGNFNCDLNFTDNRVIIGVLQAQNQKQYDSITGRYLIHDFDRVTHSYLLGKTFLIDNDNRKTILFKRYGWLKLIIKQNTSGSNDNVQVITETSTTSIPNKDTIIYSKLLPEKNNKFVALRKNREIWRDSHSQGLQGDTIVKVLQL